MGPAVGVSEMPGSRGMDALDVDTIVAPASAPGPGAVAVVRLSGPEAHGILRRLAPKHGGEFPVRRATLTRLMDPTDGSELDQAIVVSYAAPESYTGEDMVEIFTHGGTLIPAMVVEACHTLGARAAEPGEFTRRAYLRGKMDLIQAEAVADLVGARSRAFQKAALAQVERGLSRRVSQLREGLIHLEALLAHHLDFPEEDDAPVPLEQILERAGEVEAEVRRLLATAPEGQLLREGALVVLAGLPNAGKSSLYNALIGEERAIVTEVPGTTRDLLECAVEMGGFPFRLADTAGLRETEDRVERLGVEVAERAMAAADAILFCVEAGRQLVEAERHFLAHAPEVPVLVVRTKSDLFGGECPGGEDEIPLSVVTGLGLDVLRSRLVEMVYAGLIAWGEEVPVLTSRRQAGSMLRAAEALAAFRRDLAEGIPAEVAATHLGTAGVALEELLGVISVEDVLDVVFREFCVGK